MNVRQLAARVGPVPPQDPPGAAPEPRGPDAPHFAEALRRARHETAHPATPDDGLTISGHAQQRLLQRGISMSPEQRQELTNALGTLNDKGARDALVLRTDAAFVVHVPSRTIVTALDRQEMAQRVFTQIDGALLLP